MDNPDPRDIKRAANLFKVLSHPGRLRIVCFMLDGRVTTQKELIEHLGWPQSTVNRHLSMLRDVGLVVARREGNVILIKLEGPLTNNLLHAVCDWVHPETGESFTTDLAEEPDARRK